MNDFSRCEPLKLYKVIDPAMETEPSWDSWMSYVCVAANEDDAKSFIGVGISGDNEPELSSLRVEYLGEASLSLVRSLICQDFRNG